jgi:hypothetical protein
MSASFPVTMVSFQASAYKLKHPEHIAMVGYGKGGHIKCVWRPFYTANQWRRRHQVMNIGYEHEGGKTWHIAYNLEGKIRPFPPFPKRKLYSFREK